MAEQFFLVSEPETRLRLDEFLSRKLIALSRLHIRRLCEGGEVLVNGTSQRGGYRVATGESVAVVLPEMLPNAMTPEPLLLEIVHESHSFLVINKPAGMLVHPTRQVKTGTLLNGLAYYLNQNKAAENVRPGLAHRLDRETSGLLAIAKTQRALSILTRHFQERRVDKRYLALVHGIIGADELTIDAPIGRDESERPFWRVLATGRSAQTRLRVLQRTTAQTFVELEPLTGRTNQLRIHCAHIGHPIVGDQLHGKPGETESRLHLHAAKLAFNDPDGGGWREFHAPWPKELALPGGDLENH